MIFDDQIVLFLDIKPENLLISKNDILKLCDFGKYLMLQVAC